MAPAWSWWPSSPSSSSDDRRQRQRRATRPTPQFAQFEAPPPPLNSLHPKRDISDLLPASPVGNNLHRRQQQPTEFLIIPATYTDQDRGPQPGTVIGATLGSVCGFLLLLFLIYSCFNMGGGAAYEEEDVVVRERRGSRSSRNSHSRSTPPVPRSPARTESRVEERIIVEERRTSNRSPEDEIVEVIEEEEPIPRRARSSRSRPQSGYRAVEPDRYAGGNHPMEEVYVKRGSRRR
ncbi:MAG: hypothetical protein M1823_005444 [Watsoniomyces obsoletus]|nr:MAG: hypothetical protein M1823_005444 [Watsoniomyces obsoletus]